MTAARGPKVVTFGCRLNSFESERIRDCATKAGQTGAIIVNTCAVTAEAERQARQAIRRLRRENPTAMIVVTGCAAQIDPERYAAMSEVDRVLGNAEKMRPESYAHEARRIAAADPSRLKERAPLISGFDGRARAFAEIQQGCNHRCSFCVIPKGRGPNRSADPEDIIRQIRILVEKGFSEIVLTGVDLCSYGADRGEKGGLAPLVRRILAEVPELPRLRLSSLDPASVGAEMLSLFADEPRLAPHLHLSVQAGDDMVLRRMRRRHTREDVLALVAKLREARPGCAIGADLIAGFPTEDETMFENSATLIALADFSHLHVFPYSPRPGTEAARLPQLDRRQIKDRAKILRRRGEERAAAFLSAQIGTIAEVLVEKTTMGHSAHYLPVLFRETHRPGAIIPLRIKAVEQTHLIGEDL